MLIGFTLVATVPALAKPRTPLPFDAYDGGVISADSLARGGTVASAQGTLASGSENPAAASATQGSSYYVTAFVGQTTDWADSVVKSSDPVRNRVLQYISMGAEKGTLFFEPLGRREEMSSSGDYEFSADAIGFSAAEKYKGGSIGLSLAYLHGSLGSTVLQTGNPDQTEIDTGNGIRLNIGFRYPTGPFMWGMVLQNFPGIMWWKDYKRDVLPMRVRIGNTWRLSPGVLFSAESDTRYYQEGGKRENFLHFGAESPLGSSIVLKAGVFSNDIGDPKERHYTGGVTFNLQNDITISYALENYELFDEKIKKSYLSVQVPLSKDETP